MKFEKLAREILGTGKTVEIGADSASWSKKGGYADTKMTRIHTMLDRHGFKMGRDEHGGVPDGSIVTNGRTYTNQNEEVKVVVSERYGVTADSNRFRVAMTKLR